MFTGIVQGLCEVTAIQDETNLRRLHIAAGAHAQGAQTGASVSINGACLTISRISGDVLVFDVIGETLGLTNLGGLQPGDKVNVERSYRVGDEIGGHILSGHVCDSVTVAEIVEAPNARDVYFRVQLKWLKYLHHKGFVALDGASLTLASVDPAKARIGVSLIPETIARTTLGRVRQGERVNLEIDAQTQAVVDTVERMLESPGWRERAGNF